MSELSYTDERNVRLFKALRDLGIITKVTEWKEGREYCCKIRYHSDKINYLLRGEIAKISKSSLDSKHAARSNVIEDLIDSKNMKKSTLALAGKILNDTIVITDFTEIHLDGEKTTIELIYLQNSIIYEHSVFIFENSPFRRRKHFYREILSAVCSRE